MLAPLRAGDTWLELVPKQGPGAGKHVVFLAGDEEYRSEEALPMLAEVLARQGFKCTVLFSVDAEGRVDPTQQSSLSHPQALDSADLIVMALRFRNWPDETMKRFEACLNRGVPLVALRTSTHAFNFPSGSPWEHYSFNFRADGEWNGGFGRRVLGETWVGHHGKHKQEGTRTVREPASSDDAILRGVGTIFAETDVYVANPPKDAKILLRGEVTASLKPDSAAVAGPKNQPKMPVVWTRELESRTGGAWRIFTTTLGAASDLDDSGLRRLVTNAVFWGLGMEIPEKMDVEPVGEYHPTFYGFGNFKAGCKPKEFLTHPSSSNPQAAGQGLAPAKGERIALVGNGIASRMGLFGHFETELHLRYPEHALYVRNFADEGNTPGFRPHSARDLQFAFPEIRDKVGAEFRKGNGSRGFFATPDECLSTHSIDRILLFFGSVSAFRGEDELPRFENELRAYLRHLKASNFNGRGVPKLTLIGPTALEDLRPLMDQTDIDEMNRVRARYSRSMQELARDEGVPYVDLFAFTANEFAEEHRATLDGLQLSEESYRRLAPVLVDAIFGQTPHKVPDRSGAILNAVREKNHKWLLDYKIPNGVHVFGRRYKPFGPGNYPDELRKLREMTVLRDEAIWAAAQGRAFDLGAADAKTHPLPPVESNYFPSRKTGNPEYLVGDEAEKSLRVPEGYRVELFADEQRFPRLVNPVQMRFDNRGRLWVACWPSYPHWRPGEPDPDDCLLILEDSDGDGKADHETVFASGLHVPTGFEFAADGVYVMQGKDLVLLRDRDGDDCCDEREVVLSGFDDHDTHHAAGAFETDPAGGIFFSEGIFLHSDVETVHGTVRGTNGGFFRFDPVNRKLERAAQLQIPNPWGTAFDHWGQAFFLHTSGPTLEWMTPGRVKPIYGVNRNYSKDLIPAGKSVRPTAGLELISSRHFPEEVQGDLLINNTIGLRGIRQHAVGEEGTGYKLSFRQDLLQSSDGNFRPVDLEFAPDGSLYLLDWSNTLIGHMQHSARDPFRDHAHGRVYRITYPSRPLVQAPRIAGASVEQLLDTLKVPELRTRQRARRELRGRPVGVVIRKLQQWLEKLDPAEDGYWHHLLEGLWVQWGAGEVSPPLLRKLLQSPDHRARAAAVTVLRYQYKRIPEAHKLLLQAAADSHGRVRLEALIAASWLGGQRGMVILKEFEKHPVDDWMKVAHRHTRQLLSGETQTLEEEVPTILVPEHLSKTDDQRSFKLGHEVFHREAHCATCHQSDGKGLPPTYPPLVDSSWVTGNVERLAKIVLHGLEGEIEVDGKLYGSETPPMTAFGALLEDDEELAAVLTYVRNSWGNQASVVSIEEVARIRREQASRRHYWTAAELLADHPMPKVNRHPSEPLVPLLEKGASSGPGWLTALSVSFVVVCGLIGIFSRNGGN